MIQAKQNSSFRFFFRTSFASGTKEALSRCQIFNQQQFSMTLEGRVEPDSPIDGERPLIRIVAGQALFNAGAESFGLVPATAGQKSAIHNKKCPPVLGGISLSHRSNKHSSHPAWVLVIRGNLRTRKTIGKHPSA